MMGGNTPAVPNMSDARITNDELDAILAEVKEMWAALINVARMVPGSADIVEPRSKLPEVVAMVFDQAKVVQSENAATQAPVSARAGEDFQGRSALAASLGTNYARLLNFVQQVARENKFADRQAARLVLKAIGEPE